MTRPRLPSAYTTAHAALLKSAAAFAAREIRPHATDWERAGVEARRFAAPRASR